MTKEEVIKLLNLAPLTIEGGYFNQVFKSDIQIDKKHLPPYFKAKSYTASTSIYYLLGGHDESEMHAVSGDEIWSFYTASSKNVYMRLTVISPTGEKEVIKLGSDLLDGQVPQYTVKGGYWMGGKISCKNPDKDWALMGTVVAPSFEYADFVKMNPI